MQAARMPTTAEGGRDGDALENVDQFFDQRIIKDQMELAVRMAEVTRATSEWHWRMTAENLSQSGYVVDLTKYPINRPKGIHIQITYSSQNNSKGQESQAHRSLRRTKNNHQPLRHKINDDNTAE
jgi:hypothetical protein